MTRFTLPSQLVPVARVQSRYWLRHKLQAALCVGGVALGVALFCAIELANAGALAAFADGVDAFLGKATHRVFSPSGRSVPDRVFADLAKVGGVEAISPLLQDRIRIEGLAETATALGVDPLTDSRFRGAPFVVDTPVAGSPPSLPGDRPSTPLSELLAVPGAALVPAPLAARMHVRPGDRFRALAGGRWQTFSVAGLFEPEPGQARILGAVVILDVSSHQEAFGKVGGLDAVRLILASGAEAAVAARLPAGLTIERVGQRMERVERMSHAFRLNLEVLGLFALLVGAFLILNAATFSVVQREALVALQRCIGATRRAVLLALLLESAVLGAAGGAIGVVLGWFLAQRLVLGTATTLFEVILDQDTLPAGVRLTPRIWALGLGVGVAVACCGALLPALEAGRVPPLQALQSSRWVSSRPARVAGWIASALMGALLGWGLLAWPGDSLALSLAGATLLILAGALLCPAALGLAGAALSPVLRRVAGAAGLLAGRQLSRSVARTGLAAASLMVAIALALAVGITVASFRYTFGLWLDQTLTADLYLSAAEEQRGAPFPVDLIPALRALPSVRDVAELRSRRITLAGRDVTAVSVDAKAFGRLNRVPIQGGDRAGAVDALAAGATWVSETLAYPLGLRAGGSLRIPSDAGAVELRIAAIVQNYSAPTGIVYVDHATFRRLFGPVPTRAAALWLRPGADAEAERQKVLALPGGDRLRVALNAQLRDGALRVFDRTFAITRLMSGLAATVAFISVVSASTALLDERRRTHGYLGAIGVQRRTLVLAAVLESALAAFVAGGVSCGVGYGVSALLVFVVNRRAFGWTLQFLPAEGDYAMLVATGVAAAVLGSLLALVQLWRSPVLATIREE